MKFGGNVEKVARKKPRKYGTDPPLNYYFLNLNTLILTENRRILYQFCLVALVAVSAGNSVFPEFKRMTIINTISSTIEWYESENRVAWRSATHELAFAASL